MNINYRVDRVNQKVVPCGMNSIRYLGDSEVKAYQTFQGLNVGFDRNDQPNAAYGVILSVWDDAKKDYIIKCSKGI